MAGLTSYHLRQVAGPCTGQAFVLLGIGGQGHIFANFGKVCLNFFSIPFNGLSVFRGHSSLPHAPRWGGLGRAKGGRHRAVIGGLFHKASFQGLFNRCSLSNFTVAMAARSCNWKNALKFHPIPLNPKRIPFTHKRLGSLNAAITGDFASIMRGVFLFSQSRAVRRPHLAHNQKVGGSNPSSATLSTRGAIA